MAPNKRTKKPEKPIQRRPYLRPTTQSKWDQIKAAAGWDTDADVADRLADFFMQSRGIAYQPRSQSPV